LVLASLALACDPNPLIGELPPASDGGHVDVAPEAVVPLDGAQDATGVDSNDGSNAADATEVGSNDARDAASDFETMPLCSGLIINPSSFDYDSMVMTKTFSVTNPSPSMTTTLTLQSTPDSGEFTIQPTPCTDGGLPPDGGCSFVVDFQSAKTSQGLQRAMLEVTAGPLCADATLSGPGNLR
jgi:hypothetical protein